MEKTDKNVTTIKSNTDYQAIRSADVIMTKSLKTFGVFLNIGKIGI